MKNVKNYYKKSELWLPEKPGWRVFKFQLQNDQVINLTIRNEEGLRRALIKHSPKSAWYSMCYSLNPQNFKSKVRDDAHYPISDQLFLFQDILLDFDSEDLEQSRMDALEAYKRIKMKLKYILFTGGKGFHLVYENPVKDKISNPKHRESNYEMLNNLFASHFRNLQTFDVKCTVDTRRVGRLPLSIHKSGRQATFLTPKELEQPIKKILSKIHTLASHNGNDKPCRLASKDVRTKHLPGEGSRVTAPGKNIFKFITNRVEGKKDLYVPFIIVDRINKDRIKEAIEKYNLTDCHVINQKDKYGLLFNKVVDFRRCQKIIKYLKGKNSNSFKKYKNTWIITSNVIDKNQNEIYEKPKAIEIIQGNKNNPTSRPHNNFLTYVMSIPPNTGVEFVGNTINQSYMGVSA